MKVKVPPGVDNGMRIRYEGKGENTHKNVPPGDLYVTVNVSKDDRFVRHGINLSTTVQIDYIDAILGTETIVSTIDGGQIKLKIPENTIVGQTLRIPDRGMPIIGSLGRRGDLHVELLITPPKLNTEQLEMLRKIKNQKTH
jgi:molecular chaperone DnaJ